MKCQNKNLIYKWNEYGIQMIETDRTIISGDGSQQTIEKVMKN